MIAQEIIRELENVSAAERLYLMEILLNSLKQDIKTSERQTLKRFTARPFNLGHSYRQGYYLR